MHAEPTHEPFTAAPAKCQRCGDTGYTVAHGPEDYGCSFESETCESCEFGQTLIRVEELEQEVHDHKRETERLQKIIDSMAAELAFCVRIGTGVNLQARTARGMLERHGYTVDRAGWLEGEAGYNPDAPPWKDEA